MNFPRTENETEVTVQTTTVETAKPTGVVPEHMKNPNAPTTIAPELYNQVVNYRSRLKTSSGTIES